MITLTMFGCKLDHLSSNTYPSVLKVDFDVIVDIEGVSRSRAITTDIGKVFILSFYHAKKI